MVERGWLHAGSVLVADNVKFPGAPAYRTFMQAGEGTTWRTAEHETHAEYQTMLKDLVLESEYLGEAAGVDLIFTGVGPGNRGITLSSVSGDRLLELARNAKRRAHVKLTPDQQGWGFDPGQQITLIGLGHQHQLRLQGLRTDIVVDRRKEGDELGRRVAGEQPGQRRVELAGRR